MGIVKGFAGPLSAIDHDGRHYPVGTRVELPEEVAARMGVDAFTPATDREMTARLQTESKQNVERAQAEVTRAQADHDAIVAQKEEADQQHERSTRHLQLQLAQKDRLLKDAQKRLADAKAAASGEASSAEKATAELSGGTHVENAGLAAPLAEKLKTGGFTTVASVRKASDEDLRKAKVTPAELKTIRDTMPPEEGGRG